MIVIQRCPWRRCRCRDGSDGSGAAAADFLNIHRGSDSIFFEDIEKVHEFDEILVFTGCNITFFSPPTQPKGQIISKSIYTKLKPVKNCI